MTHFSPTPRETLPRSARSRLQNERPGSSRNPITVSAHSYRTNNHKLYDILLE